MLMLNCYCPAGFDVITQNRLKELLIYNPDTGLFFRIKSKSNSAKIGYPIGTNSRGYLVIYVDKKLYFSHRLAWLYMTGNFPANMIDHIDGVKSNNKFQNLRDVTNAINTQNTKHARLCNKSTGLLGVSIDIRRNKFVAQLKLDGINYNLGIFDTAELAHQAYLYAKRKYHKGNTI